MEIRKMLKDKRAEYQLTQEQLAEKIFVSKKTISNWETGRTSPDIDSLIRLANLFDLSLDNLLLEGSEVVEKINKDVKNKKKYRTLTIILTLVIIVMASFFSFKIFKHEKRNLDKNNIISATLTDKDVKINIKTDPFYIYRIYTIDEEACVEDGILEITIAQSFHLFENGNPKEFEYPLAGFSDKPNKIEQMNILDTEGNLIEEVKKSK
ncbi:MAG: helix-turn-helix transcriptional regulator [Bacilli bacterium]